VESSIVTNAKIAGLGDFVIALGTMSLPPGGNKLPKNDGSGKRRHGKILRQESKGLAPQNTFTAQGADILVSNDLKNNLIEICGGVIVQEFHAKPRTVALNW